MFDYKVAVLGPGSTGCFLAGILDSAGCNVTLIGREERCFCLQQRLPLTIDSFTGYQHSFTPKLMVSPANQGTLKPDHESKHKVVERSNEVFDLIFVMVKAHQLKDVIPALAQLSHLKTEIVLMQNGIGSDAIIRDKLPGLVLLKGITQFNVVNHKDGIYHKATEGDFWIESSQMTSELSALKYQDTKLVSVDDIESIINGKLLLNLNNALNAIVDIPIKQQLQQRRLRKILAAVMEEWLLICRKNNVSVGQLTSVSPSIVPKILRLPNFLFNLVAQKMIAIDPSARSSMWDDIESNRKTEVEYINHAVVKLGEKAKLTAPVNSYIVDCIHQLEQKGRNGVDTSTMLKQLATLSGTN
ncbi:MAG: 2-dehydropantoate 2-reductase [Gammaproteobacteria bacterium]|nr:2-dehydropantoate 2-reductase [Gammaproteobacteria bacterium]